VTAPLAVRVKRARRRGWCPACRTATCPGQSIALVRGWGWIHTGCAIGLQRATRDVPAERKEHQVTKPSESSRRAIAIQATRDAADAARHVLAGPGAGSVPDMPAEPYRRQMVAEALAGMLAAALRRLEEATGVPAARWLDQAVAALEREAAPGAAVERPERSTRGYGVPRQ
jgi:hypothetical protein